MAIHIASSPYRSTFQPRSARKSSTFSRIQYSGTSSVRTFLQNLKQAGKAQHIRFSLGPMVIIVGLALVAVGISALYLMNFNKVATDGYALKRVEQDNKELMDQYEIQNMKLAELASMQNIIQTDTVANMRHPRNVMFVRGDMALASR